MRYYSTQIDSSVYDGREQSQEFYNKRFFTYYKDLLDREALSNNKDKYIKETLSLFKFLDRLNIDFHKNLLFFSNKDIYNQVFLYGFSKREKLLSHQVVDSMEMLDIYLSTKGWNNNNISNEDAIRSDDIVKRDVLCIYSNDFLTHWKSSDFIVPEMIESRYLKTNKYGDKRVTWVFYRGDRSTMANNIFMCSTLKLFNNADNNSYQIIDLANLNYTQKGNNQVSIHTPTNSAIDDIY